MRATPGKACVPQLKAGAYLILILSLFFFLNIYILLKYSWLTMFQGHSKVIQLSINTYIIFEIIFYYRLLQDTDYSSLRYKITNSLK